MDGGVTDSHNLTVADRGQANWRERPSRRSSQNLPPMHFVNRDKNESRRLILRPSSNSMSTLGPASLLAHCREMLQARPVLHRLAYQGQHPFGVLGYKAAVLLVLPDEFLHL
jgi:hypothetical protein